MSHTMRWESHIDNVVTLDIEDDVLHLATRQTHSQDRPPITIYLREHEQPFKMYNNLIVQILRTAAGMLSNVSEVQNLR